MRPLLDLRPEVATALAAGAPVVALESTVFVQGLPPPHNLEAAARMEAAVREQGAVPAAVGVLAGRLVVGLRPDEIEAMVAAGAAKVSTADLAAVLAAGRQGATTVASTAAAAARAGVRVLATGGIGGVHRGSAGALDVSADLTELARTPVCVVCSGAKSVLDLPRTLEALETLGVPVIGFGTDEFPAFYTRESGLALAHRVESPEEAAEVMASQWDAGLPAGVVLAHPPPAAQAVPAAELQPWIDEALAAAAAGGVRGKEVTPFLLAHLARASHGRTLAANLALLEANSRLAARIAVAYGRLTAA